MVMAADSPTMVELLLVDSVVIVAVTAVTPVVLKFAMLSNVANASAAVDADSPTTTAEPMLTSPATADQPEFAMLSNVVNATAAILAASPTPLKVVIETGVAPEVFATSSKRASVTVAILAASVTRLLLNLTKCLSG